MPLECLCQRADLVVANNSLSDDVLGVLCSYINVVDLINFVKLSERIADIVYEMYPEKEINVT